MNKESDERYNNGRLMRPVGVWKLRVAMALTRSHYTQKMRVKMCGSVCGCVRVQKQRDFFWTEFEKLTQ